MIRETAASPAVRAVALLVAVATLLAACEPEAAASPTPGTVSGAPNTNIALAGARKGTIILSATCGPTPVNALINAQIGKDVYLLEIAVDAATAAGSFDAATGGKADVTLSNAAGQAWTSHADGGSGTVSVSGDLRSGTLDVTLANAADNSTVHATGPWKCGH